MSKLSTAWRLLRTNRRLMLLSTLDNLGITKRIPDESYIKMKWRATMGTRLDLERPKTFNEKIQWLKLHDRRPEYTMMVDKYRVKEYVAGKIGEEHVIPLLGVWERAEDIDFDALPNEFVLKCNHNSGGGMCICRDKAKLDIAKARNDLAQALKRDYYLLPGREWAYKDVPRRVIAEKYMTDGSETGGGLETTSSCALTGSTDARLQ